MNGLKAENITCRFGGIVALNDVSLEAPPGRITGLIGPNGAGKTTLFNVCSGFQRPDEGKVLFNGTDFTHENPARRARRGLGRTFQQLELFGSLTVRENVSLVAEADVIGGNPFSQMGLIRNSRRLKAECAGIADELLEEVGLTAQRDRPAKELTTGQGRLLEVARALARSPSLLLLDEPSSGLDVRESAAFGRLLRSVVANRGVGLLLVEHDMALVLGCCEWIYVLDFGVPLMSGTPADVRTDERVRAAYLGRHTEPAAVAG